MRGPDSDTMEQQRRVCLSLEKKENNEKKGERLCIITVAGNYPELFSSDSGGGQREREPIFGGFNCHLGSSTSKRQRQEVHCAARFSIWMQHCEG